MKRMYSEEELNSMIEAKAQEMIESGEIENAKPIYWHGLDIYNGAEGTLFKAHILNNSPSPFNTLQKLKDWFLSFGDNRIDLDGNGCFKLNNVLYPAISLVKVENGSEIKAYYQGTNGYESAAVDILTLFVGIGDRVRKIN